MTAGCLNEYHPEYRPQTSTTYVQNVSYPTTFVTQVIASPVPVTASTRPSRSWRRQSAEVARSSREVAPPPLVPAPRPEALPIPPVAERASYIARGRTEMGEADRVLWTAPQPDQSEERARCRAGDASSCRALPGIHLSGNIRIHGNVTMFGDVFLNDGPSAVADAD